MLTTPRRVERVLATKRRAQPACFGAEPISTIRGFFSFTTGRENRCVKKTSATTPLASTAAAMWSPAFSVEEQ